MTFICTLVWWMMMSCSFLFSSMFSWYAGSLATTEHAKHAETIAMIRHYYSEVSSGVSTRNLVRTIKSTKVLTSWSKQKRDSDWMTRTMWFSAQPRCNHVWVIKSSTFCIEEMSGTVRQHHRYAISEINIQITEKIILKTDLISVVGRLVGWFELHEGIVTFSVNSVDQSRRCIIDVSSRGLDLITNNRSLSVR